MKLEKCQFDLKDLKFQSLKNNKSYDTWFEWEYETDEMEDSIVFEINLWKCYKNE